jgi:hypothetical protein
VLLLGVAEFFALGLLGLLHLAENPSALLVREFFPASFSKGIEGLLVEVLA